MVDDLLLGNEFCIYTGSFVQVGLPRTFFARDWRDGWPVIDDEAWLVAAETEGVSLKRRF